MTLDEFKTLVETWGSDIRRWPQDKREAARALAGQPEASALLAEAGRLDSLLAGAAPRVTEDRAGSVSYAVVARLAGDSARRAGWRLPRWLMPAVGLACAALIGLVLGLAYPITDRGAPQDGRALLTMIFDSGFDV